MTGMNRPITRISIAVLAMFVILLVNVNYLQAVEPGNLAGKPDNPRAQYNQNQVQRGNIVTADGHVIATSKPSNDSYKYQRTYSDGPVYAPVTGFDSVFTPAEAPNYATGVEKAEYSLLAGTGSQLAFRNFIDMITNKPQLGATVQVTINSQAQQVAYQQLATTLHDKTFNGHQEVGGVVAINPSTGAILAMASYPSYNPNQLAVHNTNTVGKLYQQLSNQNPSPLINVATQTELPPGSTFKIVTSSAWYNQDVTRNTTTVVSSPQPLPLPNGHTLNNDSDEQCGNGSGMTPVLQAFAQSCNTPFAKIGIELGGTTIQTQAAKFGFNNQSFFDIPGVTASPGNFTAEEDPSFTAYDAIGQHDTTETPLQEAMIAAAVANNGVLMKPYLIQQVTASDLASVYQASPQSLGPAISPTIDNYEKQMMLAVVQQPEGTAAAYNVTALGGLEIAGKTGTAETGVNPNPDAVFTAFAPFDNPKIAVGVMIQGGGYGASAAAPIAVAVIQAYLKSQGISS
jgi:peptidoglycan glycosyltransferase